ncbi:MAG: ATP-binding protein [Oligoflexales bacterium]
MKISSIKSLYSAVHTVKGSAGTYGFNYLTAVCHRVEDAIESYLNDNENQLFNKQFDELIDELFTIKRFWNQLCQYNSSDERVRVSKQRYYQLIDKIQEIKDSEYAWIVEELEELEAIEEIEFSGKYHRIFNKLKETQDLYIESLEIEIPKGRIKRDLAEVLDPILIHLVKNAIAHGIEGKKEREQKSKCPGKINIKIHQTGNEFQISIKDNGRGIDPEKIAKKALEKEIISPKQYQVMSTEEKIDLIFKPQLSTKNNVSISSGRGIGMYSVKSNLDKLAARISVTSKVDVGTEFYISIPKTSLNQR